MAKIVYKHSAGGIILKDNSVLLIHWDAPRGSYDFPKGGIEPGETMEIACLREVLEETGYRAIVLDYIGQTHYEYDWFDGTHHDKLVDYYLLALTDEPQRKPAREAHETFENIWVTVDEAMNILTRDIDKDILQKALSQSR